MIPTQTIDPSNIETTPFMSFGDFEIEYDLIGSILRKGSAFDEVIAAINSDMVHNTVCRDIFTAMQKVKETGLVLDVITVGDQLDRDGLLSTVQHDVHRGRAALSSIRERGNAKNINSYIEIVKDYWAKREIDKLSSVLVSQSRSGRRAVDILADARVSFDNLDMLSGQVSSKTYSSRDIASSLYDHVESASNGNIRGCPTGFIDLDKFVTMMAGDVIIIGGRPGQGKSALLGSVALQAAQIHKKKIGMFSLEMSKNQVSARLVSQLASVPVDRILKGNLENREWPLFTHAIEELEYLPISINDQSGLTIPQLRTEARRMKRDMGGLDLLVVDYAQLMRATRRVKNRNEEIGEITKGLKEVGKELDVPVLAAAQMSRNVEQRTEKRPVLSDLRESGDLENDADIVMFLYKPSDVDKQGITELIVAKHRNGPLGTVELIFRGAFAKFENASLKVFSPNS